MTEIPAVELLQEARGAALAELAHRLADEEQELARDLLAAGSGGLAVAHDLGQCPRVPLCRPPDHDRRRPRALEDRHAASRETMSPEAITGTGTRATSSAVRVWSAPTRVHLRRRARVQGEPLRAGLRRGVGRPRGRRGSRSGALGASSRSPGRTRRSATAETMRHARSGSSSRVAPAPVFVTFLTGQPKLMSTTSAPAASTMRAASAITAGSDPKIWTASGCSSAEMSR